MEEHIRFPFFITKCAPMTLNVVRGVVVGKNVMAQRSIFLRWSTDGALKKIQSEKEKRSFDTLKT